MTSTAQHRSWLQGRPTGAGYVRTRVPVVFMMTLVQGDGLPRSIVPGFDRLVGIVLGISMFKESAVSCAPSLDQGADPFRERTSWACSMRAFGVKLPRAKCGGCASKKCGGGLSGERCPYCVSRHRRGSPGGHEPCVDPHQHGASLR